MKQRDLHRNSGAFFGKRCRRQAAILLLGMVFCTVAVPLARSGPVQPEQSVADIRRRIDELGREAGTTTDMSRLQEIARELGELGQALQNAYREEMNRAQPGGNLPGTGNLTVPTVEEERARETAVSQTLADKKDDPCYPVLFQKEYARRYVGSDLPWVSCVPLEIHLRWDIEEHWIRTDKWPTGIIRYLLDETYPGYLSLEYNQSDRRTVESFHMEGPSPEDDNRIGQRLVSARASGLLAEAYGTPTEYRTVGTEDKDSFEITLEGRARHATTAFHYQRTAGEQEGSLAATRIELPSGNLVERPYHLVYPIPQHISGVTNTVRGVVTLDEMLQGLKEGRMIKEFPVDLEKDFTQVRLPEIYRRSGTVRMEVLFNALGSLQVKPAEGWRALGPDENDRFLPVSKVFAVSNAGRTPLQFRVEETADWLLVDTVNGLLAPGQGRKVRVAIDQAAAGKLAKGTYPEPVRFINETNGSGTAARTVTLEVDDEQRWEVQITGFDVDDFMKQQTFKDIDGTTKIHHKRLRFQWALAGRFVLKKAKGGWMYKSGQVTAARITPIPDFLPAGIYACNVVQCIGSAPISTMVGEPITGIYSGGKSGGKIRLFWPPRIPEGCVHCTSSHPAFPKTAYEGSFQSKDFISQIGLESFPLADGYSRTVVKKEWLRYTVKFKRLK